MGEKEGIVSVQIHISISFLEKMSGLFEVKLAQHGILRNKSIRFARNYVRATEQFSSVQDSPFPYHLFIRRRTKLCRQK